MGNYTRISAYLSDWPPYRNSDPLSRCVWLGLYTSQLAKMWIPGLLRATVVELADALALGSLDLRSGLNDLADRHVIEVDASRHVIRLTALPDKGERPASNKVLRMFWARWCQLPESPVKYNHIKLLYNLSEPWRTDKLQSAWNSTFGGVNFSSLTHPVDGRNEDHTVSDTVNPSQPGLFTQDAKPYPDTLSPNGTDTVRYTEHGIRYPVSGSQGGSDQHSGSLAGGTQPGTHSLSTGCGFGIGDLLLTIGQASGGRVSTVLDPRNESDLERALSAANGVTLDDVRVAGEFLKAGHLHFRTDLDARWLGAPGTLVSLLDKARQWDADKRPALSNGGGKRAPAPAIAHPSHKTFEPTPPIPEGERMTAADAAAMRAELGWKDSA